MEAVWLHERREVRDGRWGGEKAGSGEVCVEGSGFNLVVSLWQRGEVLPAAG